MAVKKCCVATCKSRSTRKEDQGVTFHKFPKDVTFHEIWITVTHYSIKTELPKLVCSRHFCKNDFQIYKDTKYVLKSDAVPSIFPWVTDTAEDMDSADEPTSSSPLNVVETTNDTKNDSSTKEVDIENVDAIKKFIEDQEKEIQELKLQNIEKEKEIRENSNLEEKFAITSVIENMVINESELEISKRKDGLIKTKQLINTERGNSSMALSIGSKVEAKDFSEEWHPAEITEVDFDEMEVLVHYEDDTKKLDEWISVSSPRLRPLGSVTTVKPGPSSAESLSDTVPISAIKEELKESKESHNEKSKLVYTVGERCLARWRDNRRFIATVSKDLGDGSYEVIFDDGCVWNCKTSRLYKLKEGRRVGNDASPTTGSPIHEAGPSVNTASAPLLPYHTHLFDPARDYLPSKSERREMKRKLNIKEIFNIGQKKPKIQRPKSPREGTPKDQATKKPRNVKKSLKVREEPGTSGQIKSEIPAINAVASIIGTVDSAQPEKDIKPEPIDPDSDVTQDTDNTDIDNDREVIQVSVVDPCDIDEDTEDTQIDFDPVLEEEVKLENFEKQDPKQHVEVLDRIKEAINKLEDGLNKERLASPILQVKLVKIPDDKREDKVSDEKTQEAKETEIDIEETVVEEIAMKEPDVKTIENKEIDVKTIEVKETAVVENETKDTNLNVPEVKEEIKKETPVTTSEVITETLHVTKSEETPSEDNVPSQDVTSLDNDKPKKISKAKKSKKLRLLREKKVKKQVEKVKSELKEMRRQMEEMRKQMMEKSQYKIESHGELPETFLLPGEWSCKWVNGQPVGTDSTVSEPDEELKPDPTTGQVPLPKKSVKVEDKRLPPGWTKHMIRRRFGHSAGKWDVVLINPENRRFHTKNDMRNYLDNNPALREQGYEHALLDFGIHLKLARRMGWISTTAVGVSSRLPAGTLTTTSPLVKRKKLGLKRKVTKEKRPKLSIKIKKPRTDSRMLGGEAIVRALEGENIEIDLEPSAQFPPLEDGYVYCGSLKVQIIENLLRCPAEGCFKNFRNTTLLQMHIKHYHRELRKMMGATPKVLDLAYARSRMPEHPDTPRPVNDKIIKVKIPRPPKREEPKIKEEPKEVKSELQVDLCPTTPVKEVESISRSQDSPKLRQMLVNKPVKRPRVLLPVRRPEETPAMTADGDFEDSIPDSSFCVPTEGLDFESAISTHTVTKPLFDKRKKGEKKRKSFALVRPYRPLASEDDEFVGLNSDVDTRSSFPRSGTPDSKADIKTAPLSSESNEDVIKEANMYTFNENGERIKIVHMKREEIINCHCGVREEDGLMVQCELCLCWQHALCHNIQREADVPEKYTCSICLNPRRGRRSQRFLHDQDRLYEGLLPGSKPDESLRRSHELSGNLLRIEDALHALRVKYYVATKKDHPKLYLWAKDWEYAEIQYTQEKLNSDYSDLNIMISNLGKENLPIKPDDVRDLPMDIQTPPSEEHDRYTQREGTLGSQSLLSGLLSSPGGASIELPISTSELERLAKSVQEQEEARAPIVPVPEAAIENSACKERLLKHLQRCQALIDSRLDSIEAQVAELEAQDPSLQDDETPDYLPKTKQTVQLLLRDLDAMEELGVIT